MYIRWTTGIFTGGKFIFLKQNTDIDRALPVTSFLFLKSDSSVKD